MTSTSIRAPRPAGRERGACLDEDLRGLADQMRRCAGSQGRWERWHGLLARMRSFTASHVTSVTAAIALMGGLWWLVR